MAHQDRSIPKHAPILGRHVPAQQEIDGHNVVHQVEHLDGADRHTARHGPGRLGVGQDAVDHDADDGAPQPKRQQGERVDGPFVPGRAAQRPDGREQPRPAVLGQDHDAVQREGGEEDGEVSPGDGHDGLRVRLALFCRAGWGLPLRLYGLVVVMAVSMTVMRHCGGFVVGDNIVESQGGKTV